MKIVKSYPLIERDFDDVIAFRANGSVCVSEFVREAIALAKALPDHQYVINLHTDRYRYLLGFCAAIIAGQCILMPANRQPQTLEQLKRDYPDVYSMDVNLPGEFVVDGVAPGENVVSCPQIAANQLCAIAFTSGSTGVPAPNFKYWQTLRIGGLNNNKMLLADLHEPINLVATVSAQHMWGMETSILLPMFGGAAIGHVCPFFPQDIADALVKLPPHRGLISSPVHLEVLLRSGVQLPGIKRIFSATSPLSTALACQLEASLNTQVLDIFGSSESGIIANRQTSTESLWNLSNIFELVTKADGFEIRADHLPENVLIPDIVEKTGEGKFRWLGRHQDIVNIAGKRGSFRDLNQRLRNVSGVEDGVIFFPEGRDDHLAALVVAPELSVTEILNALKPQVDPVFLPRSVYSIDALPRQETGKLASVAVNNLFDKLREASKKRA